MPHDMPYVRYLLAATKERAIAHLIERRATCPDQIPQDTLPAGAPMTFYCEGCGWVADILPEHYFLGQPRKRCTECEAMVRRGWL